MGGGGKTEIDALARASGAQATATRGRLFRFWEREGKALGVPANQETEAISLPCRNAAQERHPCTARRQSDALRAGLWASGRPASREARVPAGQDKNAAPLGARSAGQCASLNPPAHLPPLPIVTQMGRDYRPGPRQRIERVAR